jgi:hypothetical protein
MQPLIAFNVWLWIEAYRREFEPPVGTLSKAMNASTASKNASIGLGCTRKNSRGGMERGSMSGACLIMRRELGPRLYEYMPAVSIGVTHSIVGVRPNVGEWPLILGHMG